MYHRPSNEYVLNVAFLSFLAFTTLQFFFAVIAKSQAMMADCAAMYVDVVTYLFNFLAERLKHGHSAMSSRQLRLHRLYLELVPPLISVCTLVAVTVISLRAATDTILRQTRKLGLEVNDATPETDEPDLMIMTTFSTLNLLLDGMNVGCFARVNQAVGLVPGNDGIHHHGPGHQNHQSHEKQKDSEPDNFHHDNTEPEHPPLTTASPATTTESTPLLLKPGDGTAAPTVTASVSTCSSDDTETPGGLNLNMCSAWTHIFADTLRSAAVLLAVGLAYLFPNHISATDADAGGAIVVSIIILLSLLPLIQGLWLTMCKIRAIWEERDTDDLVIDV